MCYVAYIQRFSRFSPCLVGRDLRFCGYPSAAHSQPAPAELGTLLMHLLPLLSGNQKLELAEWWLKKFKIHGCGRRRKQLWRKKSVDDSKKDGADRQVARRLHGRSSASMSLRRDCPEPARTGYRGCGFFRQTHTLGKMKFPDTAREKKEAASCPLHIDEDTLTFQRA